MFKKIIIAFYVLSLAACASSARMDESAQNYQFSGDKFGQINVKLADKLANDPKKAIRSEQLNLETSLRSYLSANQLFDETSQNQVNVYIDQLHMRNGFNAVMFGPFAGKDYLGGKVTLVVDSAEKASFDVKASYALGGIAGGNNSSRLSWMSEKFAEVTANTIKGKK